MKKYLLISFSLSVLTVLLVLGIFYRSSIFEYLDRNFNFSFTNQFQEQKVSDFTEVVSTNPDYKLADPEKLDQTQFKNYSNQNLSMKIPSSYTIGLDGELIKISKDSKNYILLKSLNTSKETGRKVIPSENLTKEGNVLKIVDPFTDYEKLNITKSFLSEVFLDGMSYKTGKFEYKLNDFDQLGLKHRFYYYRVSNPNSENTSLLDERYQVVIFVGDKKTIIAATIFEDSSFETLSKLKTSLSTINVVE